MSAVFFIDASWGDIFRSALATLSKRKQEEVQERWALSFDVARRSVEHKIICCLSARSALDLYLQVKRFPPGSQVLMSAINIPDISVVLRHHGLIPVPVDIHTKTLAPKMEGFEKGFNKSTVAILVAHLWGRRFDMEPVAKFAEDHKIDLIEDCAEAFGGFDYTGHKRSDFVFWSFGAIKIATAFGGAVAMIRDPAIYTAMNAIHDKYEPQSSKEYLKKVAKGAFAHFLLDTIPPLTFHGQRGFWYIGVDVWGKMVTMLRGFPDRLMERLRQQPSSGLLETIKHRVTNWNEQDFQRLTQHLDVRVTQMLPTGISIPGADAPIRNYWLYPIILPPGLTPDDAVNQLRERNVFAARTSTQLALVPPPVELEISPTDYPTEAAEMMSRIIYLPVHKNSTDRDILRTATALRALIDSTTHQSRPVIPSKL